MFLDYFALFLLVFTGLVLFYGISKRRFFFSRNNKKSHIVED